jgi:16S rRNA (cytidine1402-2'-O)-methyltransferase
MPLRPERTGPGAGRVEGRGTLFVVATPIGNLEDITLRALRILRDVHLIAAEDTRRTGNLLRHYEIRTPLVSLHEHNERQRVGYLVRRLDEGESVALVTDAGTPGISDPGAQLVCGVREAGIRIEPIPGASSVVTALSVAGQSADQFVFLGFPPIRLKDRNKYFGRLDALSDLLIVLFEAPHRVGRTLNDLAKLVKRPIMIGRELTKAHEELVVGMPLELNERLGEPRGEFTIVIPPVEAVNRTMTVASDESIALEFGEITKNDLGSRREAIRKVAEKTGMTPKAIFQALERIKNIGQIT